MKTPTRLFSYIRITFLIFLTITVTLIVRDAKNNWHIIENITLWLLAPAVFFSILDTTVDFLVWYFYLTRVTTKPKIYSSFLIFFAGFATDIVPAKMGAFSRAFFLLTVNGMPIRKGMAVQLNSFLVDFCAAVLIGSLTLIVLQFWVATLSIIVFAIFILFIFFRLLKYDNLQPFIQRLIRRFVPSEMASGISEVHQAIVSLLKVRYWLLLIPFKGLSWFFMGMVLFYISTAFDQPLSICECVVATTLSSLCGTFSMIPYGIAVTEASLVGFQVFFHVPVDISVMVALIYRSLVSWNWLLFGNIIAQFMIGKRTSRPETDS